LKNEEEKGRQIDNLILLDIVIKIMENFWNRES